MKVPLSRIAHTRSGDKGDTCNIGVIACESSSRVGIIPFGARLAQIAPKAALAQSSSGWPRTSPSAAFFFRSSQS